MENGKKRKRARKVGKERRREGASRGRGMGRHGRENRRRIKGTGKE